MYNPPTESTFNKYLSMNRPFFANTFAWTVYHSNNTEGLHDKKKIQYEVRANI